MLEDRPNDITYELHILLSMINQLPPTVAIVFRQQLSKILNLIINERIKFSKQITDSLEDVDLNVKLMKFDLDCTKAELNNSK